MAARHCRLFALTGELRAAIAYLAVFHVGVGANGLANQMGTSMCVKCGAQWTCHLQVPVNKSALLPLTPPPLSLSLNPDCVPVVFHMVIQQHAALLGAHCTLPGPGARQERLMMTNSRLGQVAAMFLP